MSERKPRVHPLVPTRALDWQLGRVHVATPDSAVVDLVETAIARQTDPRWTAAIRRQTVRYALWRHHRNFAEFARVMRGGR